MNKLKIWLDANLKNCCHDEKEININDEKEILLYILKKLESIENKLNGGGSYGCPKIDTKKRID